MDRKRLTKYLSLSLLLSYGITVNAAEIDRCLWGYANIQSKVNIINKIAMSAIQSKEQMNIKSSRGDIVTFDFIPGSKDQEPVVITGGLWYKIQYFEGFSNVLTAQSLLKETLMQEAAKQEQLIKSLSAKGHPIIIVSRSTQQESVYNSLKNGVLPSYTNTSSLSPELRKMKKASSDSLVSLQDHAKDIYDVVNSLKKSGHIGSTKIQLTSLSYGVGVLREFKRLYPDMILHSSIIAPLSSAGDNFPKETAMQDQFINNTQMMFTPLKLNPFTYFMGNFWSQFSKDSIYSYSQKTYSQKIVDGNFSSDPDLQAREKEFPGYKEVTRQGLANDMDASRPDRFNLADEKDFELYKNSTIYLAGDEEPARLKSQLSAYLKMKEKLGDEAPNLVFMDDSQHAITATAPTQTAHIFSTMMLNDNIKSTNGAVFYMHRVDNQAKIQELPPELFKVLVDEVNKEAIGPNSASMLEVIFYPQIFAGRIQITAQAAKDLADALQQEQKQTAPVDFKEDPTRPYQKLLYVDLTPELRTKLNEEVIGLTNKLKELQQVQENALALLKQFETKK
jgi:hypothetical protein